MSETKKSHPSPKKTVIVTSRPILKDDTPSGAQAEGTPIKNVAIAHTAGTIKPPQDEPVKNEPSQDAQDTLAQEADKTLSPSTATESSEKDNPPKLDSTPEEAVQQDQPVKTDSIQEPNKEQPKKDDPAQAKRQAATEQLISSKKYELPINAVEKRKTMHFVVLGVLFAILLALLWVDVALDAGLIKINGIKPVTHLFSN